MDVPTEPPGQRELLVVSNRLPVTLCRDKRGLRYQPSVGGLATALSGIRSDRFLWVGWPGAQFDPGEREAVRAELLEARSCVPVFLSTEQTEQFYNRFCNGVIWPLFHYLPEFTDFDLKGWKHYREVNELFADVVGPLIGADTVIWVHDYHLMLLPGILRARFPSVPIGFFLHIPFPSSEVYRLLPVRCEILRGLLGADVIGFHTYDYARHFRSACMRLLGFEATPQLVEVDGRRVSLSVSPIGIDYRHFQELVDKAETQQKLAQLRGQFQDLKVILGVDRLDYSKGLRQKLKAFERFLERNPRWRGKCVLVQVAVPSRTGVERYQELRREIEELVGHVNGLYSKVDHAPVHFMFQGVPQTTLSALYQLADVCWVSSIRDGMNLVCQEYVVSKGESAGVLLLSEFAGAAHALDGAIRVNPWNLDQMAEALREGLDMPQEQARQRTRRMQKTIESNSAADWAGRFLALVRRDADSENGVQPRRILHHLDTLIDECCRARRRFFLLDYDGTLRPFAPTPDEAMPVPGIQQLLRDLAALPRSEVYVVSGRTAQDLERWLGMLPIGLCAEHGWLLRKPGQKRWLELVSVTCDWMSIVEPIMNNCAAMTPGALVERKGASLAWHWRRCDPEFGQWQANELAFHLNDVLANQPVEVINGHKVVEVRAQGPNKGALVRHLGARLRSGAFVFAAGDDRSDEDLFAQLPPGAWSCRVGVESSHASFCVDRQSEMDLVLKRFLEGVRSKLAEQPRKRNRCNRKPASARGPTSGGCDD